MFEWAKVGLAVLQVALWFLDEAKRRQQFNAGHDSAVLDAAKQVMARSDDGKRLMEKIDAMSDADVDDLADRLGRSGEGG